MTLHSINEEQRLYVLPSGSGYSCLGFDVAQRWAEQVNRWLPEGRRMPLTAQPGTAEHFAQYEAIMAAGGEHNRATGLRCYAQCTPQLIGLENRRVEVIKPDGTKRRFWVGRSTGWLPIHLEIKTRRSTGGIAALLGPRDQVRVVEGRR